ncbi:carboxypeptidase M32 [Candidatus Bipolaricaulota bacterium]|nr:carboxypeptidase M32 [Candidatus Bipolaricaulota bacterium]
MDTLDAYKGILAEIGKLSSAQSLLGWDQQTHMPDSGSAARAEVLGKLSRLEFELSTSDELGQYLETLEGRDDLTDEEAASVRDVARKYRREKAIPPDVFEAFTIARSRGQAAWAEARASADFERFRPNLAELVDFARQFAEYYGYVQQPYDALLEPFEPGMTSQRLQEIIAPLRAELVPFLKRLQTNGSPPDASILRGTFPIVTQREMSRRALELIGYDFGSGTLDDAPHPFTSEIAFGDVRVTNRYEENDPVSGLFGALHEGGHALYGQGMGENLYRLQLSDGASFGIHESQSRLLENQIGRGRPFWRFFLPILGEFLPQLAGIDPEAIYRAVNLVSPSLIRVEADEVTYNFHIMLRFELESALINGAVRVEELPTLWNDAMARYLGVVPDNDAEGVLQDVHWSMGAFGYFPSYMLGNLYAAQLATTLRADRPDLDEEIAAGSF